jgi:signal transduction histidine kinase
VVALSHEINNPLMALRAQLDMLRLDAAALPPGGKVALEQAGQQFTRIAELLKRLRELDHEASTTYVGGTRMTDLAVPPGGSDGTGER